MEIDIFIKQKFNWDFSSRNLSETIEALIGYQFLITQNINQSCEWLLESKEWLNVSKKYHYLLMDKELRQKQTDLVILQEIIRQGQILLRDRQWTSTVRER
eukprot:TRINITY_DN3073_c2_g2_i1.p1 TRINITY_DN3073_c2_g2~~TRINITY_DN3073_c2_g2_i1.p1  ORF type:complete len:112 (-),score=2.12 TRINITY_DN3073_c2_g2_i1:8-310(-)